MFAGTALFRGYQWIILKNILQEINEARTLLLRFQVFKRPLSDVYHSDSVHNDLWHRFEWKICIRAKENIMLLEMSDKDISVQSDCRTALKNLMIEDGDFC